MAMILFLMCFATAVTAKDGASLARALDAMRGGDWAGAQIAARGDGPIAQDIILWHKLRAGRGSAREVQTFLERNGDWPGLPFLREKSEAAMVEASHADVRAFYADDLPRSGTGALALARAHLASGERGAAEAEIVLAWRTLAMSDEEIAAFRAEWPQLIAPHHVARLDYALWQGWESNTRDLLPMVPEGWRALAEARLALRTGASGVDGLIAQVPDALAEDPGLAYERFRWRWQRGRHGEATALLLARSSSAAALGEPWAWARARRDLTRRAMRAGNMQHAYEIASNHHLVDGSSYADLEWLAGYLALRQLGRPADAVAHFQNFREAVFTPISIGRAGYWLGRAHEALGETELARAAYRMGAAYQTSFYGLLAAERGGFPPDPLLAGDEDFPDWREAEFTKNTAFAAAILLFAADELDLAERFITHLSESLDRTAIGQLGEMLVEMDRPHVQVMLGKRAARAGLELAGPYYALHSELTGRTLPVAPELALAIARRESEFDPDVISPVGARGFMQLMPGTAREMAGDLDMPYSASRLLSDPAYNVTLGSAYLAELAEMFDGNAVMMAAGYNAGPSRPISWMERNGDPRRGRIDIVDWIEMIPFTETRHYVMRVTESLPVYRARLGKDPHPVPFSQELIGRTFLLAPN